MSNAFFHKPELALRRALELEGINQEEAALALLHEILSSRRQRTWSPAYEQIMMAYLNLCLKLHKSREAKDGLHQYRNLSQSQAPGSLEKVIRYLMQRAEQKCSQAKENVDAKTLAANIAHDGDDGEAFGASPQAILLSSMSTDPAASQRDSNLLLPSLKFLWETYRAVLDILRSNSKLEHVYHAAAQAALKFCCVYKRRTEFRHLCDMLRMHLGNLRQYGSIAETGDDSRSNNKIRGWEGWSNESIELHLETRFAQLDTSSALHRYTEGFRTVEDIYNILQISHARRKVNPDAPPPKAKLMAAYYEKLTTLFWVSENYLFHAFAWHKYYTLCKEFNRGMSEEMKRMQASAVLLAALCIPSTTSAGGSSEKQHGISSTIEDDIVKQKMGRMATLLGFHTRNPTREALLIEIRSKNIISQVPQYLRDMYYLLEDNLDPLVMVATAHPLLEELKKEIGATTTTDAEDENDDVEETSLARYVKPLTSVLLLKLLTNLSSAYHTVSMDHLKKLTVGLDMTFEQVETAIVLFTQTKTLSVRIDHRAGCLRFGDAQLESDVMRSQLTVLSKQLEAVCHILQPPDQTNSVERRSKVYQEVRANLVSEHQGILDRKNFIEKRKETSERLAQEKVREEARVKTAEEAARKAEEEKRIAREQRLRELDKQKKIAMELANQEKKRFLLAMGKNMDEVSEDQISKIDTDALQKEHQAKQNKKREDAERKTKESAKKLDYLVRATRIEELPLIKKKYEENNKNDRERYENESLEKVKRAKLQWEADIKDKQVLEEHGVFEYFAEFEESVLVGRRVVHEKVCEQADRDAEFEAERAKIGRARKRKDDEMKRRTEEEARFKKEEKDARLEAELHKREGAKREREAKEEERRQAEVKRMDDERQKSESARGPSKYVPPSQRREGGAGGGGAGGGSRFGGGGAYPGGGRYEGRDDRRGGGDDRGGGDRRGGDDRRGGGGRDDDRRGGGGSSDTGRWR